MRNKEGSRCLQLQTRLRGGVDDGGGPAELVCERGLGSGLHGQRARVVAEEVGWGTMT